MRYKSEMKMCCNATAGGSIFMNGQNKPNKTGLTRLLRAVACSRQGFRYIWRSEEAFRQEVLLCIFFIPLGFFSGNGGTEQALLIGSILLIPLVEVLNTAIECTIDRIGPEFHELSGHAKDLGSSAVLLSICITVVVWGLVLWP